MPTSEASDLRGEREREAPRSRSRPAELRPLPMATAAVNRQPRLVESSVQRVTRPTAKRSNLKSSSGACPGAARKLRRAAKAGDPVSITDLLDRVAGPERQANEWALRYTSATTVLYAECLEQAAKDLELMVRDATSPRKRLPVGFASRERQDSSGIKNAGPYGRGRRRRRR